MMTIRINPQEIANCLTINFLFLQMDCINRVFLVLRLPSVERGVIATVRGSDCSTDETATKLCSTALSFSTFICLQHVHVHEISQAYT